MNRVFVIGDTHFGHRKIIGFEAAHRPFSTIEEHDEALIERWNATVTPRDTVWHLGDVLFGAHSFAILPRLNGIKKLVMGNHDRYPSAKYLEHFRVVAAAVELRGCILTHIPVHPGQFARYRGNIHGHSHSKSVDDARYVCVSAEQTGLAPLHIDAAIARLPTDAQETTANRAEGKTVAR